MIVRHIVSFVQHIAAVMFLFVTTTTALRQRKSLLNKCLMYCEHNYAVLKNNLHHPDTLNEVDYLGEE